MSGSKEDYAEALTAVQEGDYETAQEIIGGRYVSVNALDDSGCSFLHWAAINNRVRIARLLIEMGISGACTGGGGVLGESPLQWAVRKKYYAMMELIVQRTQCDISHKSLQGNDALQLACKLGDINAAFLLLQWGADPDTIDGNGDTPLLWLSRNRYGRANMELVRLLLRFGANALAQNQGSRSNGIGGAGVVATGDCALHALLRNSKADSVTAFLIYQAAGSTIKDVKNTEGLTPYNMAVAMDSRPFARFLYDCMLFSMLPYHLPTVLSACCVISLFLLFIPLCGFFYGVILWLITFVLLGWSCLQWTITDHRDRIFSGSFVGICICLCVTYRMMIAPQASYLANFVAAGAAAVAFFAGQRFVRTRPQCNGRGGNKAGLAEQIVQSAPPEGTDEEVEELLELGYIPPTNNNNSRPTPAAAVAGSSTASASASSGGTGRVKFVKDAFTGRLIRQDPSEGEPVLSASGIGGGGSGISHTSSSSSSSSSGGGTGEYHPTIRARTMGPKVCGSCLADRRGVVKPYLGDVKLPSTTFVNMLLPYKPPKTKAKKSRAGDVEHGSMNSNGTPETSVESGGAMANTNASMNRITGGLVPVSSTAADEVITMAIHCNSLDACVIDMDHHCLYLKNCVGKGNRRLYWLFLFSMVVFCYTFFFVSMWMHQHQMCTNRPELYDGSDMYHFLPREWCAFTLKPGFYLLTWLAGYLGFYFMMLGQVQLTCVCRETTFLNVIKQRFEVMTPPTRRMMRNLLIFLYTGLYNVTYPKRRSPSRRTTSTTAAAAAAANPPPPPFPAPDGTTVVGATASAGGTEDYKQAMELFSRIDAANAAATTVVSASAYTAAVATVGVGAAAAAAAVSAATAGAATSTSSDGRVEPRRRTATYTAPMAGDLASVPEYAPLGGDGGSASASGGQQSHQHGPHCKHAREHGSATSRGAATTSRAGENDGGGPLDNESDYDEEFVQSPVNSYLDYYDDDSGDDSELIRSMRDTSETQTAVEGGGGSSSGGLMRHHHLHVPATHQVHHQPLQQHQHKSNCKHCKSTNATAIEKNASNSNAPSIHADERV